MKRLYYSLLALFLSFVFSFNAPKEKSLLWRVSGNGLEKPSFLFGTIHLIPEKDYFFSDMMESRFDSCTSLMMEVKMDMSFQDQMSVAKKVMMPAGKTYQDYMTADEYKTALSFLQDTIGLSGTELQATMMLQPIMASSMVFNKVIKNYKIYESELNKLAKKRGMSLYGFETLLEQTSFITSMSLEEQFRMTDFSSEMIKGYYQMVDVYKDQDLNGMWEIMIEEDSTMMDSEFYEKLLLKRNLAWIPKIEEQSKKESTFYAVGAAHLGGDKGVIQLLIEKGYTVVPVKE